MSNLTQNESDDEEIPLRQLKEKIQSNKQNDDDIPLNILAKSIKNSIKVRQPNDLEQTAEPQLKEDNYRNVQQSLNTLHEVDHLDYFRTVGDSCDDEGHVENATEEVTSVESLQSIISDDNENDLWMECDGCFDLNETFVVDSQNDLLDFENLNVLMPLFKDFAPTDAESVHVIIESQTSEKEPTEFDSVHLENGTENETASEDSTIDTEPSTERETDNTSESESEPHKISRSRRPFKNPEIWKQNIRKRKRNAGEEYTSCRGQKVKRRSLNRKNCRCRFKCFQNIKEDDQQKIFRQYWALSYGGQRDYIKQNVKKETKAKRTTTSSSRRKYSYQYYLDNEHGKQRVCKTFFLDTLNIGEKTVSYTLSRNDGVRCQDQRGKKPGSRSRVISQEDRNTVREHIESFPTVQSHYCRKTTTRKYLEKHLSIRKMYELYREKCKSDDREPVKYWLYDHVFCTEYNIGFHRPKKDICTFCDAYEKMTQEEKEVRKNEHHKHLERKQQARDQKRKDKDRTLKEENILVVNFDLQKVLITPKMFVSDAYYSRKLSTYNFTTYDLSSRNVQCFVWNETEAKRGSCEISTCLYIHNKEVGEKDEIIYYSDSCTGQQRNLQFCIMCLLSVSNFPIKVITHNYFERGHSQMEGDSVHATIENSTKRLEMYSPNDWLLAIKNAKQTSPKYAVREIHHTMILDFKECASSVVANRRKDTNGDIVHWNKIHSFQYRKDSPNIIFFKYDFSEDYRSLNINHGRRRMKSLEDYCLKPLYRQRLPISDAKRADLMGLCDKGLIPSKYHNFYNSLPYDSKEGDILPEPNSSDESEVDE